MKMLDMKLMKGWFSDCSLNARIPSHSLVTSWFVPNGVTFCMLSHGGMALSPFRITPQKKENINSKVISSILGFFKTGIMDEGHIYFGCCQYLNFHALKNKMILSNKDVCGIFLSLTSILLRVSLYSLVSSISLLGWISSVWSVSFWQMGLLA